MDSVYVVAEIGQNHNGSMTMAKALVDMASNPQPGHLFSLGDVAVDAVKFCARDLATELTPEAAARSYSGRHAFGSTYGKHREALEFSDSQYAELFNHTTEAGVDFVITICGAARLKMFERFTPAALKVASRDLTNLPLIDALATTGWPLILSTGMAGTDELDRALDVATRYLDPSDVTILHCVSAYPAEFDALNLQTIPWLITNYPAFRIGYSDHSVGIVAPVAAVGLGARVIEKHISLDRTLRGTDQAGSLERDGLYRMLRDIRGIQEAVGSDTLFKDPRVADIAVKLERSLVAAGDLPEGHRLHLQDLDLRSPGDGIPWSERLRVVGRVLRAPLKMGEQIPKDILVIPPPRP